MTEAARRTTIICLCLFALAFAVRMLVWHNNKVAIDGVQYVVTDVYQQDARLLTGGDLRTFLAGPDPPSDATIIMHPPGYPMFIAAIYLIFGEGEWLRIVQVTLNSLAAILIFFLAGRLFGERTAIAAGLLTAISPQFAYHSAILLPDELSSLPVIAGLYFVVRALQEKRLILMAACGTALGSACWFRSNTFLLPFFVAVVILVTFPSGWSLRPAALMLAVFLVTIAPMTIRNYAVFSAFVPVSVGFGTTFIEGLGELDKDGRTGMPTTDEGVMTMDAERAARPEYFGRLYAPDGVERERARVRAGVNVIREYPGWFVLGALQRGLMAFRMERVPVIEPRYDERSRTPTWLYYLNVPLKLVQRLFITAVVLPLLILGVTMLLRNNDGRRKLALLVVVPIYFVLVQPIVHTEYRYLLAATHVIIVLASVPLGWAWTTLAGSDVDGLAGAK